jgi:phosphohistidine phosphatase
MPARRLYVLRHGKSSWDDPALADWERPLSGRGRRACKLIAAHLREQRVEPATVIVSPALRTRQTYDRISRGLPEGTPTWTEPRLYGSDAGTLLEVVQELPDEFCSALLIGHNPAVQSLGLMLAGDGAELPRLRRKLPTGSLLTIGFAGPWRALRPGAAELESMVRPKQLG